MTPPSWLGQGWLAPHYLGWLLHGAAMTAALALCVSLAATLLGILLCAAQDSRQRWLRWPARLFCSLHRNTPLLVQVLLWYFGAGGLLPDAAMQWLNTPHQWALPLGFSLGWPPFEWLAAWLALSLYSACFISAELAAGLNTVARGQRLAARALGMTEWQIFRYIVLPQALRVIRQPLLGQYTAVIKNTSLTMAIGVAELSYTSRQVESETLLAFQAFAVATALYLLLVIATQLAGSRHAAEGRIR
ncbi:amino acid ABC transporter permease [Aquitalea denitrificans]|uniref:amino acid ABC transporter permease n=1 Tax=Aquitalea denitrificans TaxID=519081 RepID=UPI00142EB2D0|nr:amino acid ABC transporter permease [Aquitalea denitrificans]